MSQSRLGSLSAKAQNWKIEGRIYPQRPYFRFFDVRFLFFHCPNSKGFPQELRNGITDFLKVVSKLLESGFKNVKIDYSGLSDGFNLCTIESV